jgi:hypothetical protein
MNNVGGDLHDLWRQGYSIAELWGNTDPVSRGGPSANNDYLILWGILSIVEDQVRPGAGHEYLRDRLWHRDWLAIGFLEQRLAVLPPIDKPKFGRKPSAISDGTTKYIDVRVVHRQTISPSKSGEIANV